MIGSSLENEWGTFRFNLYYLIGVLGTAIAAFITKSSTTAVYINLSLFLTFARLYPNYQIMAFFFIPIKVKYLAYFNWFFIIGAIIIEPFSVKLAAMVAIANYLLFFGKDIINDFKTRKKVYHNRRRFQNSRTLDTQPIHRCTVCGITEKDDPNIEFRYCTKCDGHHEYCMKHLKNHKHIKYNHLRNR